jgi:hypothetical protein
MDWKTRKEKLQVNGSGSHAADKPAAARPFPPQMSDAAKAPEATGTDWGVPADLARLAEASSSLDEADQLEARRLAQKSTTTPTDQPTSLDAFAPYRPEPDAQNDPAASGHTSANAFQFQSIGQFTPPANMDITEPSTIFSNHPKPSPKQAAHGDPNLQSPFTQQHEPDDTPQQFGITKRESVASGLVTNDDEFGIPRVAPFIVNMPGAPEPIDVVATDRVLILKVRNLSATYPLTNDVTTMGRPDKETQSYPDVEIELDDSVSRKHAEVRRKANDFFLIDLGSTNGTMLNGSPLRPGIEVKLQHGDRIRLGERTELVFE